MGEHAFLSPSAAYRWSVCPDSPHAEAEFPDSDSVFSREGTFAHDIAAQCLDTGLPAKSRIGHMDPAEEFTVDREMADHLQVYLDYVDGIVLVEDCPKPAIEQKVVLARDLWGTADAVVLSGDGKRLHIIDLKFGQGKLVTAFENKQLVVYAMACLKTFEELMAAVEEVTMHIVQPRRLDSDGNATRSWKVSRRELVDWWMEEMSYAADEARKGGRRVPGDHCHFCKARRSCHAVQEQALAVAQDVFPKGDPHEPVAPPAPSTFTTEQLGELLQTAGLIELWISGLRDEAYERARAGQKVPGFKLVQKQGNRKWIDEARAEASLRAAGVDPFSEPKLVSPAEAERRLKKQKVLVKDLAFKPVTGAALVAEGDKRPELPADAASVFDLDSVN